MHLIKIEEDADSSKKKQYSINVQHPLYGSLRSIILKYVGIDQVLDQVIHKLGNVDKVYLTGDIAKGKNANIVDLILVGNIDKMYLYKLIEKVEPLIDKKIRVGLYATGEFTDRHLDELGTVIDLIKS